MAFGIKKVACRRCLWTCFVKETDVRLENASFFVFLVKEQWTLHSSADFFDCQHLPAQVASGGPLGQEQVARICWPRPPGQSDGDRVLPGEEFAASLAPWRGMVLGLSC